MIHLGSDKNGWRRFYCVICGHVEWVAPGEALPTDYECPLCEAPRSAMLALDDPRLARHRVTFAALAPGIWQIAKSPLFRPDFNHYSYLLEHPNGLILYDAPPLVTDEAIEQILAIGKPRWLVVSHTDFVGLAGDWAEALGIPSLMGAGDLPVKGNRFTPSERIFGSLWLADDLEVRRVPGHSEGSLALYWQNAPAGNVLCAGDALTVWPHHDGRVQLAFLQSPPAGPEIVSLAARAVDLLLTCGGYLRHANAHLQKLIALEENCARPWRGESNGVWLDTAEL
jgi:glyoxylase-like metal-dependent hydrolase (beta-lactamase superfamily II)